ncbi:uncharacterized protein [Dermacentor albipictus]|uniref:uncharacterized protein isoform X3 n=1 Tax=Dermacentor albipictus TaxID=60249 RepID=UPI0031FCF0DD
MSSEFSRRPMTTASDSSSQSSDGAEINANQTGVRGDDTDSSPKVLLTDVEHLPQPKVPPGSTAEKGTVSALKRGVTDAAKGTVKPGDAMAIVAPRTPSVGSATKRSLDYSTESINRAVRLAQQNLASVWQRPPDQRSGRRGGEKPGYDDEEGMVATPPGGGGRGATGRARPTKHPKAVASPAMRAPAPPAVVSPPAAQIGGVRPGAKEPVRPRLLSEKGLVRAVPAEHALKTGTAVEHPSAQPMASGAEVTAKQPPGSGMTDARRRYSVAASPESPEQRMQPSGWVAGAPMQQRRPSYFASREDLGQRRKSIVSDALAAGSGRRPLSVGFRRSLEDTWNRDSDEETSSSSPPLEDTATAPVLPLMRRPPADLKPPTEAKRPSVTVKPPSAVMTPVALPAATSKPPEVTAAVTSSAEPEKTAAAEQVPLAPLAVSATPAALTTPAALATPVTSATPAPLAPPVPQAQPPPSATVTKPLVAQKHDAKKTEIPAPKSTWWTALAHPFSLPGSLVTNEEAPVPAHARRHSMAPGENQRAQARSNVRMKRAPHVTEELKDFAALLGGALGFTGGGQTAAGPSAAGNVNRGAPQHNEMIEDILDYEYEPRLQQTFESEGTDLVAHRRRRKFGCVGLCGRCFVLFFLISAACGLLFFTFHLGRTLSKNLATPGAKLSTTGATSKTTPYFSSRRPYIVELLPTAHCSELILYALYVKSASNYKVHFKRGYVDVDFIQALRRITNKRTHRGDPIRIHYTLGGAHEDSPNFVEMLAKHELRNGVIEDLRNASSLIDGVNIHWDRPGGACDQEFTPAYFRAFVEALYLRNMSLILTVPPVLELVRKFWLISITRYMDYVIVTTHKLRRKGVLDCSGRREFAVASYLAIRDHVLKETANPFQAAKVVYSIALGADVFRATLPLSSPRLLDAGTPSSVFDGPTVQTNKTSYDHVCRMPKSLFDGDSECAYAIRQQSTGGTELALYAGPEELAVRMRKSYASKMGDTTVAVYDLFLDDFGGNCAHAGGSAATTSPLVVAIAETGLQSSL